MDTKMRVAILAGIVALASGIVFAIKYDEWVKNPQLIKEKRGYAVSQLSDPESVQFRAERLTGDGWLCGETNGKNAYGAYTGFKRFMSRAPDDVHIEGSGYAGKEGGQSTEQILADLDVSSNAMQSLVDAAKANPELPVPTKAERAAITESAIFKKRWADHCS